MKNVFLGIDHPAIAADNVELLNKWYCEVLGYEVLVRTNSGVYIDKAPDGTYLEVMPKDETARPERTVKTPGFSHLALRVSDLDIAIAEMDKHHVQWLGDEFVPAGGGRIRNLLDPEGNMLQLIQRIN